ncbi:hypothetical protein DU80_08185 [Methanosarcina mazei]|uniref:Uncharacterized protein n=1 Tax=Methanosarcina mazei TaxID=2209 RepID=A0A0F8BQH5_METMZ|nr:hypothetical protein DU47_03070 [Methanosarcina mazei]KKG03355.1 hypothetical protein DU31_12685 [Methanosarcina mazei]KKG04786.1 hypothetical protein DU40_20310 [Methanosarcina mazei]KKG31562.1 hypothetical protein DU30_10025 [Methanosarcina mazei]KKG33977.1 hypothetical protein DU52_20930 [Methanosarcina mazei]
MQNWTYICQFSFFEFWEGLLSCIERDRTDLAWRTMMDGLEELIYCSLECSSAAKFIEYPY